MGGRGGVGGREAERDRRGSSNNKGGNQIELEFHYYGWELRQLELIQLGMKTRAAVKCVG